MAALILSILLTTETGRLAYLQMQATDIVLSEKNLMFISSIEMLLTYLFSVNVGLAVFNLLPIPPLDGFNILRFFTSEKVDRWFYEHQMIITRVFFAFLLLMSYVPVLSVPLQAASNLVRDLLWRAVSWIPLVFGT